jgi:hypothetical protein
MATSFLPYQSRAEASPPSSHGGARECDGDWPTPSDKTKLDRSTRCLCYCEHGCRVLTGNRVAQPPNPRRGAGPWCPNVSGEKSPPTGGLLPPREGCQQLHGGVTKLPARAHQSWHGVYTDWAAAADFVCSRFSTMAVMEAAISLRSGGLRTQG